MPSIRPNELFKEAFRAVGQHLPAVAIYLAVTLTGSILYVIVRTLAPAGDDPPATAALAPWIAWMLDVMMAALGALAATLAFSRMGRELDKPLWKVEGDGEALRRFFLPWFMLWLATITINRWLISAAAQSEDPGLAILVLLVYFGLAMLVVPVGACIMFTREFSWHLLGESLAPLGRQFAYAFGFFLFGFAVYLFLMTTAISYPHQPNLASREGLIATALYAVLDILGGYSDCVIFAGIWLVCRLDRDTVREDDDFDF